MKTLIITILIVLLCATPSFADTHAAASGSLADVYTAVLAASRGDTVTIPAGNWTWTGSYDKTGAAVTCGLLYTSDICAHLNIAKGITLQGAGAGTTDTACDPETQTCITSGWTTEQCSPGPSPGPGTICKWMIGYTADDPTADAAIGTGSTPDFRITGIKFNSNDYIGTIQLRNWSTTAVDGVRIDNNVFRNSNNQECDSATCTGRTGDYTVYVYGTLYGVIDSNKFFGKPSFGNRGIYTGGAAGKSDWDSLVFSAGSANQLYIEDNEITNTKSTMNYGWNSCGWGSRYAFRYNTFTYGGTGITYLQAFEHHGNQTAIYPCQGAEIYGNKLTDSSNITGESFNSRGGKALAYYNRFYTTKNVKGKARDEYLDTITTTVNTCPATGVLYPSTSTCASDGQPQHLHNSYYWNNKYGASGAGATISIDPITTLNVPAVTEGTHWWDDSGIGCGTSTPGTCTAGNGYWIPDATIDPTAASCSDMTDYVGASPTKKVHGTLYRCYPQNVWTPYYTPYAYPHPLRGGTDSSAPSITLISPSQEIACNDGSSPYTSATAAISLNATDQTPPVTCKWDTSVDGTPTYAELSNTFSAVGNTHSGTATNLTCSGATTIYYACTDSATPANVNTVASWSFNIAGGGDTDPATITNITTTKQAKAVTQKIEITTNKQATCRWSLTDVAYGSMANTFNQTVDTTHHDASVIQAAPSTVIYYVRCSTTQGTANSSSTEITIKTDTLKGMTLGTGNRSITIP